MSDLFFQAAAKFSLHCLAPEVRSWIDETAFLEREAARLRENLASRAPGGERLARFAAACRVEGASEADYAPRRVRIGCGAEVVAAIHFYGMDIARPFVCVEAQERALSAEEIANAARELGERFAMYRPPLARFRSPQGGLDVESLPGAEGDFLVASGPLSRLLDAPPPAGLERVSLRDDHPADYFDAYLADYRGVHEARPELKNRLFAETLDTLESYRASGLCRRACVDGEPAGVVASERGVFEGIEGWVVGEEILGARFRGQRLGPCVQRRLAEALVADLGAAPGDLLIGTIDVVNRASRKTAARCGRVEATGWAFVPTGAGPQG